eukprot:4143191-Pleurochrysis_carterae.AAC.1
MQTAPALRPEAQENASIGHIVEDEQLAALLGVLLQKIDRPLDRRHVVLVLQQAGILHEIPAAKCVEPQA